MDKAPKPLLRGFCGGIPRLYLFGGETAAERMALQNICVTEGRQPSSEQRQVLRMTFRSGRSTKGQL